MQIAPLFGIWLTTDNSVHCPLDEKGLVSLGLDPNNPLVDEQKLTQAFKDYDFAYGGFLEKRKLYERSDLFLQEGKYRNIHLGTDVWGDAGTKMYAPFPLSIHSFADNAGVGNYGPTVIFKGNDDYPFILLGHLSRTNLPLWESKHEYATGDFIGSFGEEFENGNWFPHVHIQVMKDMQGYSGDYPGVWAEDDLDIVKGNLVNPQGLFYKEESHS